MLRQAVELHLEADGTRNASLDCIGHLGLRESNLLRRPDGGAGGFDFQAIGGVDDSLLKEVERVCERENLTAPFRIRLGLVYAKETAIVLDLLVE